MTFAHDQSTNGDVPAYAMPTIVLLCPLSCVIWAAVGNAANTDHYRTICSDSRVYILIAWFDPDTARTLRSTRDDAMSKMNVSPLSSARARE